LAVFMAFLVRPQPQTSTAWVRKGCAGAMADGG